MLFARIKYQNQKRWIQKTENHYYLLNGNPFRENLSVDSQLSVQTEADLNFIPYCKPKNVFGLAFNYKSLVNKSSDFENPLVFLKSIDSLCLNNNLFLYPSDFIKIWVECELIVIIKKFCRNITSDEAQDYILGYSVGSDITAENIYHRDHHLALSKACRGFAPIHNWFTSIIREDAKIQTKINDNFFQDDLISNRIWNQFESVAYLSRYFVLHPGDIVFTGTPAGAMDSIVNIGDSVEHYIDGIGSMRFKVV